MKIISFVGLLLAVLLAGPPCGAQVPVTLVDEHFESWVPPGWAILTQYQGVYWKSSASQAANCPNGDTYPNISGGTGFFADANSGCSGYYYFDSTLVTPEFSLADPTFTSATLTYKSALQIWVSDRITAEVGITTDGGAHSTVLLKYPDQNHDHRTEVLDLTPYLGQPHVRIGFRYTALDTDLYWQVDDVRIVAAKGGAVTHRAGDCDGDGTVGITELQQVVNNQLGVASTGCGDCDGSGQVTITELQKAVNCQLGMGNCDTSCQH